MFRQLGHTVLKSKHNPLHTESIMKEISLPFTYLPPAYIVQREGNVLTRVCPSVCPQRGVRWPGPEGGGVPRLGLDGRGCGGGGGGVPKVPTPWPR